ncbi:MAG: hypothetical protein U0704_00410 [Candidatus Eisenbacteria bacterium]
MNRDIGWLLAPLVALAVFAFVLVQTLAALESSGVWSRGRRVAAVAADDPLVLLDATIAPLPAAVAPTRDPFATGSAPVNTTPAASGPKKPAPPPAPARPVLTAIVYDADPRALVRWQGRDYSVRAGGLFDVFQVVSISRDQVVLKRGDESIVLQRKPQGD